ncbi:MAG: hypothetical protein HY841_01030 [Bacteroidetes bacterium]|nr:hypothetical protein [Bacteroidota bacterium]
MENITENIIGGILTVAPITLLLLKLFATEYVTNFTRELFKSKSNKKANLIFNAIVVILLIIGISIIAFPYLTKENPPDNISPQEQTAPQKTDGEILFDAGKIIHDEIKEGIEKRKERKEDIIASREKRLVYQIGNIKDNENGVLDLYKKLKNIPNINLARIFVFEISRNKYFMYQNDEYSEQQINDSLENFKSTIGSIEPAIGIIDLMKYCKANENINDTKELKFRREKIKIPCCNCAK